MVTIQLFGMEKIIAEKDMASGVYFARITSQSFIKTRKMLLVK